MRFMEMEGQNPVFGIPRFRFVEIEIQDEAENELEEFKYWA